MRQSYVPCRPVMEALDSRCLLAAVGFTDLGVAATPFPAQRVTVSGHNAWVADGVGGLRGYDVTDPSNPVALGIFGASQVVTDSQIRGKLAYVTAGNVLQIVDLTDPLSPTLVGTATGALDNARGVDVRSNIAYVAQNNNGLRIYDVSRPAVPVFLGSIATPGAAVQVRVSGHFAFVANNQYGVQVIDIANPRSPQLVGAIATTGQAVDLAISGNRLFVAAKSAGLRIYDISNPRLPVLLSQSALPAATQANAVTVVGSYAYVAASSGVIALDASNPAKPTTIGSLPSSLNLTRGLFVANGVAYLASGSFGLKTESLTSSQVVLANQKLLVTGAIGNDLIQVTAGSGNTVVATLNGAGRQVNAAIVSSIRLLGGKGSDTIKIGSGVMAVSVSGGDGNDTIVGGGSNDTINGDNGNDSIKGGAGSDLLSGGAGNDAIFGDAGNDALNGNDGNDNLSGGDGNDKLNAGAGLDRLAGNAGNNTLTAGTSSSDGGDTLIGGTGADVFSSRNGKKDLLVWDGDGNDRFSIDDNLDVIVSTAAYNGGLNTLLAAARRTPRRVHIPGHLSGAVINSSSMISLLPGNWNILIVV